ncbi:WYL domain-containing protein [Nocardia grenadensis]|uniref:WYL domain-containing protein n=1 Tax=Nocardia grenadensis TaxID=931537 RepID=UPI003D8E5113
MAADARRLPCSARHRDRAARAPAATIAGVAVPGGDAALGDPDPVPGEPDVYRLPVRSVEGAAAVLVGFGAEVDILAPAELRDRIIAIAEAAGEHHRTASGRPDPADM